MTSGDTPVPLLVAVGETRRSTKAGVRTPATPARRPGTRASSRPLNEGRSMDSGDTEMVTATAACFHCAQRRPEYGLRRHQDEAQEPRLPPDRSTKAGVWTPATRPGRSARPATSKALNEGRSMDSGDTPNRGELVPARGEFHRNPVIEQPTGQRNCLIVTRHHRRAR